MTKTQSVSATKLAVATAVLLFAVGLAMATAPAMQQGKSSGPTSGANLIKVSSCEQKGTDIEISRNNGPKYILKAGCKNAGSGFKDYTFECVKSGDTTSTISTVYKVSWTSCATFSVAADNETYTATGGVVTVGVNKLLAVFNFSAYAKDATISSLVLAKTGTIKNENLTNIKLTDANGSLLSGSHFSPLSPDKLFFTFNKVVPFGTGMPTKLMVSADILDATPGGDTLSLSINSASDIGTGSTIEATNFPVTYGPLLITPTVVESVAALTIAVGSDTPIGYNMLLGAVDQTLAQFKVTADDKEDIIIKDLVISVNLKSTSLPLLYNLRLYEQGTNVPIGTAAVLNTTEKNGAYVSAKFSNLNWEIGKNTFKAFIVKADIHSYIEMGDPSVSNTAAQLAILPDYSDQPGVQSSIVAVGKQSGNNLAYNSFIFQANDGLLPLTTASNGNKSQLNANNGYVRASEFVFYRAKLGVAWASDTPKGSASPSPEQVVGKFVVTNFANAGSYSAKIKYFNFGISSTIKNEDNSTHFLKIYKDSLGTTPLAKVSFNGQFSDTTLVDSDMIDVEISSGASKTFYVTLDTSAALMNKSLSIRIPAAPFLVNSGTAYGVEWSDGVTNDIITAGWDLPLQWKTFVY